MKYCPKCETQYEDGSLRFCTKDGSPLVEEEKPNFIEMPSDSLDQPADADDASELTVIRRNIAPPTPTPPATTPSTPPAVQPPPPSALDDINFDANDAPPPRIVVPMEEEIPVIIPPRPTRPAQGYAPPQRSNTAIVVLLTIIGTTIILGGVGILFWLLQRDRGTANTNVNYNYNMNVDNLNSNSNTNYNSGVTNFNFNLNTNFNANANANANANKSPSPTPKPSPSVTPTPDEDNTTGHLPVNSMSTPTPTPRPSSSPSNRPVNGGVLNGRAVNLATPQYPQIAKQAHASGQVMVEVAVDESGRVVSAKAVTGNPLLRSAAENAARQSRIIPSRVNNENVRTTGLLVYNFRDN